MGLIILLWFVGIPASVIALVVSVAIRVNRPQDQFRRPYWSQQHQEWRR